MSVKNTSSINRRELFKGTAGLATLAAVGGPSILRAQPAPVRVGVIHAVTGALAYSGNLCRTGILMAIEEVNANGGIKSLGGSQIEPVLADAQSRPDIGAAEVERLNEAGVNAIIGPFVSSIALATTDAAARHNIPHVVDVGVVDQVVERGLTNTFRFAPGVRTIVGTAIESLAAINDAAGKPAKRVVIVHEESAFGTGVAQTLNNELPKLGFEILDTLRHANPTRDFSNIALKIQSQKPDLVIPSNYYDEYVLLLRTLRQQKVDIKGIYSILGGAPTNMRFIREFPAESNLIMDCGHWVDENNPSAQRLKQKVAAQNIEFTLEVFLAYTSMMFLVDAIERAGSSDREAIIEALASSSWNDHFMPYGATKMVNGQNQGARPVVTQIIDGQVRLVHPENYANAEPQFLKIRY